MCLNELNIAILNLKNLEAYDTFKIEINFTIRENSKSFRDPF